MTEADAAPVYAAGWDERALYDAIVVCALFNFMNRLVDGCGIVADEAKRTEFMERMKEARDDDEIYRNFARMVGATE